MLWAPIREIGRQRDREAEAQRHKDTKTQRHRETELACIEVQAVISCLDKLLTVPCWSSRAMNLESLPLIMKHLNSGDLFPVTYLGRFMGHLHIRSCSFQL